MRALVVLLAACGTAPPSAAPAPSLAPSPAPPVCLPAPAASPGDASTTVDARPRVRTTLYARQIVMSMESRRRTFELVRDGDHVVLEIRTEALRDPRQRHLDGHELDDASWGEPLIERYAGAALDIDGGTELELFLTSRSEHPTLRADRADRADRVAWKCREMAVSVHALAARPERIWPKSTEKTGCSGSPVRWIPAGEREETLYTCGPVLAFGRAVFLPFTASRRVEWIAEWIDCHIQELAFREAAPLTQ